MLWSVAQLRIHLVWRDVADTMSYRMDGGKVCYLCRGQNYSNSRVLGYGQLGGPTRPCAKVLLKYAGFGKKCKNVVTQLYQMEWYELWR